MTPSQRHVLQLVLASAPAYAFCIWDGGFLPTEAEWEYAASGGEERVFPWSVPPGSDQVDGSYASVGCLGDGDPACTIDDALSVGSLPAGTGRWGHDDLSGNMLEWVLDWGNLYYPDTCDDCYQATPTTSGRSIRGGQWFWAADYARAAARLSNGPAGRSQTFGFRCARPAYADATVEGDVRLLQDPADEFGIPMPGVTVYADLDGDGAFDPDEPSDVSAEVAPDQATYAIAEIPAGPVDVWIVNPDPALYEIVLPAPATTPSTSTAATW